MDFFEICRYLLTAIITALLPVATKYLVDFLRAKTKESITAADAEKTKNYQKLIDTALTDVMDAVLYVNQVYTDSLKASGQFDRQAQEKAFQLAYTQALHMISEEAKKAIEQACGSLDKWLAPKIESAKNQGKEQD